LLLDDRLADGVEQHASRIECQVTRPTEECTIDKLQVQNFVDGQWRDAADGRTSDLVDTVTGEVYIRAPDS
jgi:hypothetical protein